MMAELKEILVGTVAEIPPGSMRFIEAGKFGVGVYNVRGEYHALNNYCPHMGAPLCLGQVTGVAIADSPGRKQWIRDGEIVACPWHGWKFGIGDGESITKPARRIKKYPVKVRDGNVILEMSDSTREG
jgi:nitrite reductase (NADH) small subunit